MTAPKARLLAMGAVLIALAVCVFIFVSGLPEATDATRLVVDVTPKSAATATPKIAALAPGDGGAARVEVERTIGGAEETASRASMIRVEGSVIDLATYEPVPGFALRLNGADASDNATIQKITNTRADGRFEFDVPEESAAKLKWRFQSADAAQYVVQSYAFELGANATIKPERELWVTSLDCTVEGIVVDEFSKPIPRATVTWAKNKNICDENGIFGFKVPGHGTTVGLSVESEGHTAARASIAVKPGASIRGIRFQLGQERRIRGTITNEAGAPLAGARVRCSLRVAYESISGADGKYELRGLAVPRADDNKKRYVVSASLAGYESKAVRFEAGADSKNTVDVVLSKSPPTRSISGRVINNHGAPVAGAVVTPRRESDPRAVAGADGSFTLDGLRDGPIAPLEATADGYALTFHTAKFDSTDPIIITLESGFVVSGRAQFANGDAARGIHVNPVNKNGSFGIWARTDSAGRFTVGPLPKDTNALELIGTSIPTHRVDIELAGGNLDIGSVVLERNPVLRGQVVDDATGAPISQFAVALSAGAGQPQGAVAPPLDCYRDGRVFVNARGEFEIRDCGAKAGAAIDITIRAQGYVDELLRSVAIPSGGDVEPVALRMRRL
jgi:hypothetical protein